MNETKRRAIVWDTIERIAFRPNSSNDCRAWLGVYAKTLYQLWGIESTWGRFGSNDFFDIPFLDLKCDFIIENSEKYSVSLQDLSSNRSCWRNEIDSAYVSKASLHSATGSFPHRQRSYLRRDIEAVLDGMLFHPRCHAHLEDIGVRRVQLDQDSGGLSSHEVRIGGGIENPYVFLFHLRYQFFLVADPARQTERQRLIDLFAGAIRSSSTVSARRLLNFRRGGN